MTKKVNNEKEFGNWELIYSGTDYGSSVAAMAGRGHLSQKYGYLVHTGGMTIERRVYHDHCGEEKIWITHKGMSKEQIKKAMQDFRKLVPEQSLEERAKINARMQESREQEERYRHEQEIINREYTKKLRNQQRLEEKYNHITRGEA